MSDDLRSVQDWLRSQNIDVTAPPPEEDIASVVGKKVWEGITLGPRAAGQPLEAVRQAPTGEWGEAVRTQLGYGTKPRQYRVPAGASVPEKVGISLGHKTWTEELPFASGIMGATEKAVVVRAMDRMAQNKYGTIDEAQRQDDVALVKDYLASGAAQDERNKDLTSRVTETVAQLPAFMGEMYGTAGMALPAKLAVRKAFGIAAQNATKIAADKAAMGLGKRVALGITERAAGTAARLPAFTGRAMDALAQRRTPTVVTDDAGNITGFRPPDEGVLTSLLKAEGDTFIQVITEDDSFGGLSRIGVAALGKAARPLAPIAAKLPGYAFARNVAGGLVAGWARANNIPWVQAVQRASTRAGFNGIVDEVGEEYVADVMGAVAGTTIGNYGTQATGYAPEDIMTRLGAAMRQDVQQTPEMFLAFAVPGLARLSAKMAAAGAHRVIVGPGATPPPALPAAGTGIVPVDLLPGAPGSQAQAPAAPAPAGDMRQQRLGIQWAPSSAPAATTRIEPQPGAAPEAAPPAPAPLPPPPPVTLEHPHTTGVTANLKPQQALRTALDPLGRAEKAWTQAEAATAPGMRTINANRAKAQLALAEGHLAAIETWAKENPEHAVQHGAALTDAAHRLQALQEQIKKGLTPLPAKAAPAKAPKAAAPATAAQPAKAAPTWKAGATVLFIPPGARKWRRGKVHQAVGEGAYRIRRMVHGAPVFYAVESDKIRDLPSVQSLRKYNDRIDTLPEAERKQARADAAAFKRELRQSPLYDPRQEDASTREKLGRSQAQELRRAYDKLADALGITDQDMLDPLVQARLLPRLRQWMREHGQPAQAKEQVADARAQVERKADEPEQVYAGELKKGEEVFRGNEWLVTDIDAENGLVLLKDGTTLTLESDDKVNIAGGMALDPKTGEVRRLGAEPGAADTAWVGEAPKAEGEGGKKPFDFPAPPAAEAKAAQPAAPKAAVAPAAAAVAEAQQKAAEAQQRAAEAQTKAAEALTKAAAELAAKAKPPAAPGELLPSSEIAFRLEQETAAANKPPKAAPAQPQGVQAELLAVEQTVSIRDPQKSADAAQELVGGDPQKAIELLERHLQYLKTNPAAMKAFRATQRDGFSQLAGLREVLALLHQRAAQSAQPAPAPAPTAQGSKNVAQRMVNAEERFIEFAMLTGDLTREQALAALAEYRKAKAIEIDPVGGQFSFRHGGFAERDVLRRAAGLEQRLARIAALPVDGEVNGWQIVHDTQGGDRQWVLRHPANGRPYYSGPRRGRLVYKARQITPDAALKLRVEKRSAKAADALIDSGGELPTGKVGGRRMASDAIPEVFGDLSALPENPAPAEYLGEQELPGKGTVSLYNLTADIPGHNAGSTVDAETLRQAGFQPPPAPGKLNQPQPAPAPSFTNTATAQDIARARRVWQRITGSAALNIVDQLFRSDNGRQVLGRYYRGQAWVSKALTPGETAVGTAAHEAWHYTRELLLTAQERQVVDRLLPDEEAQARRFMAYAQTGTGATGRLRLLFAKLLRTIRALFGRQNAMGQLDAVFARVESGAMAQRRMGRQPTQMLRADNATITAPGATGPQYMVAAFHGTPHTFAPEPGAPLGRVKKEKVGTGEGAAAYGFGVLYTAQSPEVAKTYRTAGNILQPLTPEDLETLEQAPEWPSDVPKRVLEKWKFLDEEATWADIKWDFKAFGVEDADAAVKNITDHWRFDTMPAAGNLYHVELDFDPADCLDWDLPWSQQSEKVRKAIVGATQSHPDRLPPGLFLGMDGAGIYHTLMDKSRAGAEPLPGQQELFDAGKLKLPASDKQLASEYLASLGIKGIRYADQGSRGVGTGGQWRSEPSAAKPGEWVTVRGGQITSWHTSEAEARERADSENAKITYNYVVFNESDIRVVGRNGETLTPTAAMQAPGTPAEARYSDPAEHAGAVVGSIWRGIMDAVSKTAARRGISLDAALAAWRRRPRNWKPDLKWYHAFASPLHYMPTVPALGRMLTAAMRSTDQKHRYAEEILGPLETDLRAFNTGLSAIKDEGRRVGEYLVQRDVDATGPWVEKVKGKGRTFIVHGADGAPLPKTFNDEELAWTTAHKLEADAMRTASFSEAAANLVYLFRQMTDRAYHQLRRNVRGHIKAKHAAGSKVERVTDPATGERMTLWHALATMGNRRGYYFPRNWGGGRWLVRATKPGANNEMEKFDTELMAKTAAAAWAAKGYTPVLELSTRPDEAVFADLQVIALNDLVQKALAKADRTAAAPIPATVTGAKTFEYTRKDGAKETHLIIPMQASTEANRIIKELGAQGPYDDKQSGMGRAWHFVNPAADTEATVAGALGDDSDTSPTGAFGAALNTELAALIFSRGSRAHNIARSDATGAAVWRGYEEDPARALAGYAKAIAGGTAKREMAHAMLQAFTGTDVPWRQFKTDTLGADFKVTDDVTRKQLAEAHKAYRAFVRDRSIESGVQARAYADGKSYMLEMLRNDTPVERIVAVGKALAALKYLSGLAPAAINMGSYGLVNPAVLHWHLGTGFVRSAQLLKRSASNYIAWYAHQRFGMGAGLTDAEDQFLYHEISARGYDSPLYLEEATRLAMPQYHRWLSDLSKWIMWMGVTERINRGGTVAAAYYAQKEKHTGPWDAAAREAALIQAKRISDEANAAYGKSNRPPWARGGGVGGALFSAYYTFMTYGHNYVQLLARMGFGAKPDRLALAYMLLAPAILAGFGGSAAALAVAPVTAVARFVFSMLGLPPPPDDPEEAFYDWLMARYGDAAANWARTGLVGLGGHGVDIRGSLRLNFAELPTDIVGLLGAPAAVAKDLYTGAGAMLNGDIWRGAERMAPRILAGPSRGIREAVRGVSDQKNQPVWHGNEKLQATLTEALVRSLGFNPARIGAALQEHYTEKKLAARLRNERADVYTAIRHYVMADTADPGEWAGILGQIDKFNATVAASQLPGAAYVTPQTIRRIVAATQRAPRIERIRGGETPPPERPTADAFPSAADALAATPAARPSAGRRRRGGNGRSRLRSRRSLRLRRGRVSGRYWAARRRRRTGR